MTPATSTPSPSRLIALAFSFAAPLLAAAADTSFKLPPETARLKPGPGLELIHANCLLCHSMDYISTQPRLNAAQWRASVLKMQAKYGAPIATNKVDALVDYLAKYYGSGIATNLPLPKK
jgi:sulfite dehydrogenase